jgi:hypothetical protein
MSLGTRLEGKVISFMKNKIAVALEIVGLALILGPGLSSNSPGTLYIFVGFIIMTGSFFFWIISRRI